MPLIWWYDIIIMKGGGGATTHATGLNEDLATASLAALAHDSPITLVFPFFDMRAH